MANYIVTFLFSLMLLSQPSFADVDSNTETSIDFVNRVMAKSRLLKKSGGITLGHMAMIWERAATQIEDTDFTGVTEESVDWGLDVAVRLRNVALMFRDVGMVASVAGHSYEYWNGYGYGWGYYRAYWKRAYRMSYARRVARYDAARFKWEQYNQIRISGVTLRRQLMTQ